MQSSDRNKAIHSIFDPHSRSETGKSSSEGKATVSSHSSLHALCVFIKHLTSSSFKDVSEVPYEVIAVTTEILVITKKH